MVEIVDSTRWAPLIGRLFIAFGRIEQTTHESIRKWAGECIHSHFARARLNARIDLAIDLSLSRDASEGAKQDFKAALTKAKSLAKYRNLVAHNPLCLVLFQQPAESEFLEAIASNVNDDRTLLFEELEEVVASAEACAEEVVESFVRFRVEKIDFEALSKRPGLPRGNA